jgi:N-acetylmuramoyl-L-alanine amidase
VSGTRRARAGLALALAVAVLPHVASAGRAVSPPIEPRGLEGAPAHIVDQKPYVGANDLARLLDAAKYWRADVRKLELRSGAHRVQLTADNPFVIVDDATLRLPDPVRSVHGELQAPVALLDSLPHDSTLARLLYDARRGMVLVVPTSGTVGTPRLTVAEGVTRLTLPVDQPEDAQVVSRAREHFRLRFAGFYAGGAADSGSVGLVRGVRGLAAVTGCAFELRIAPDAAAFRLVREPGRVTLEVSRAPMASWEAFAPEGPSGPRHLRIVVIDPGHGGADPGVIDHGLEEKDLTLALAKRVRTELERRLGVRVVLTRDDDRAISAEQRAEIANRARADLVLSLHVDGFANPRARGATALCPPASYSGASGTRGAAEAATLAVLPWREVAARYAVQSRALGEAVLSALELRDSGPTRLRETLPIELLGVNAPGLLLECATLTNPADRERVSGDAGQDAIAIAIADGVEAWQRNE